jgi:hypothetical protein
MMAVTTLMAASHNPNDSAIANGVASPLLTAPSTSARAIPIETAVTATAVDKASAAVVINSTKAIERCFGAQTWRASVIPVRGRNVFGMSISTNQCPRIGLQWVNRSRPMPARIRPDLGEGFDE